MRKIFESYGIALSQEQEEKLNIYYQLLIEDNEKINLTSITEYEDVIWKHFLDSSFPMAADVWQKNVSAKVLDVGTGAGFPGMVLAVLNPQKKFTLLDSLKKRVDFLQKVINALSLSNVEAFHGRAETFGRKVKFRNQYDFVVSRAVAELPVLMEYCIPFVKENGYFISYKGKRQEEEMEKADNAFTELGASFHHLQQFQLREGEQRYLLFIQNNELTKEKYPRKEGKPKKNPL